MARRSTLAVWISLALAPALLTTAGAAAPQKRGKPVAKKPAGAPAKPPLPTAAAPPAAVPKDGATVAPAETPAADGKSAAGPVPPAPEAPAAAPPALVGPPAPPSETSEPPAPHGAASKPAPASDTTPATADSAPSPAVGSDPQTGSASPPPAAPGLVSSDGDPTDPARRIAAEEAARAQSQRLRRSEKRRLARLQIDARLDVSFDSNILQSSDCETLVGQSTCGAAASQQSRLQSLSFSRQLSENPALGPTVYQRTISNDFATASPAPGQLGLPLALALAVEGRPVTLRGVELWLGYRFAQRVMLYAQSDSSGLLPSPETYHRQEHAATVRLSGQPRSWLHLNLRLAGYANFSGLADFTPFLGGLRATVDATIVESSQLRTHAAISYQLRRAFDEANDGYLDGNRIQAWVAQELRYRFVRPQLSYRFTYDATGTLMVRAPVTTLYTPPSMPQQQPLALTLGSYEYAAPLTHQAHQLVASARFALPYELSALGALGYEYLRYADSYGATYTGIAAGVIAALPPFAVPGTQRQDHRLSASAALRRELPHHLAVELSYGLVGNLSNIGNAIDSRSYTKHTVAAALDYYF